MKTTLVLTFAGADRPGLVHMLSETVLAHGGNWEESRMARLAGRFVGILEITAPADRADALCAALSGLRDKGLLVSVERGIDETVSAGERVLRLELTGSDHEGIVHDVFRALAERGVNVDEMTTACIEAPMSGGILFTASARLRAPGGVTLDELRRRLEAIAGELMVDIQLEEPS